MRKTIFTLLLLPILLGITSAAYGQISYTDIDPDLKVEGWEAYPLKPDTTVNNFLYIWKHPNEVVVNSVSSDLQVLMDGSGTLPAALDAGAPIDASSMWAKPSYASMNHEGTEGNWIGVEDKYLGFRFKKNGNWHYGWARLSVDSDPAYFIIKDHAHNTVAGSTINAGQGATSGIAAPSRASVESVKLYPNPASAGTAVHFETPALFSTEIQLFDATGKQASTVRIQNGRGLLNTNGLEQGIYIYRVKETAITGRLVIE